MIAFCLFFVFHLNYKSASALLFLDTSCDSGFGGGFRRSLRFPSALATGQSRLSRNITDKEIKNEISKSILSCTTRRRLWNTSNFKFNYVDPPWSSGSSQIRASIGSSWACCSCINVRRFGGMSFPLLQLKDPVSLFVKRREYLSGCGFRSRRDVT